MHKKERLEQDLRFYEDMLEMKKRMFKEETSFNFLIIIGEIICIIMMTIAGVKLNAFMVFSIGIATFAMGRCIERLATATYNHRRDISGVVETIVTIKEMIEEGDKCDLL